jgi:hypothetical protein
LPAALSRSALAFTAAAITWFARSFNLPARFTRGNRHQLVEQWIAPFEALLVNQSPTRCLLVRSPSITPAAFPTSSEPGRIHRQFTR